MTRSYDSAGEIKKSYFFCIFSIFFSIFGLAAKYHKKEVVHQSAASAVSPDYVKFQAVLKLAASAASRKPKSREASSRGVRDGGSAGGRWPWGTPLELPSLDLVCLEAALAADLLTAGVVFTSFPAIKLGFSGFPRFWGRGFSKCWFRVPSGARNRHLGA